MTDIKVYVESKIEHLETQITNMKEGIESRDKLSVKLEEKLETISESRIILESAEKPSALDILANIEEKTKEEKEENISILSHLKGYLEEAELDLEVHKKALETLI